MSELKLSDRDLILYKLLIDNGKGKELPLWMTEEWMPSYNAQHNFYGNSVEFLNSEGVAWAYLRPATMRGFGEAQSDALVCREKHPSLRSYFKYLMSTRAEVKEALMQRERIFRWEEMHAEPISIDDVESYHEPSVSDDYEMPSDPSPDLPTTEIEDRIEMFHNPSTGRVEQRIIHVPIIRRLRPEPVNPEARIRLRRR